MPIEQYPLENATPVPVRAGDVVVFNLTGMGTDPELFGYTFEESPLTGRTANADNRLYLNRVSLAQLQEAYVE